ncbi:MAG TPA: sialidase family protein [Kofleriaceae bacterium]
MSRLVTLAAVAALGCGDNLPPDPLYAMVQVTDASPFPDGCGMAGPGTSFPGVEVQPQLAVDPKKPRHLVGAWQQDRWSSGGARGIGAAASTDGGATWTISYPHVGPCAGGSKGAASYARATTPWVAFAADGTAWLSALAFDTDRPRSAVVAARSTDGGKTWPEPTILRSDDDADVFNDRQTLTADPTDANRLYVVWDRMTGLGRGDTAAVSSAIWLARRDSGAWQTPRAIYDPGANHECLGPVLGALADGTLVVAFDEIANLAADAPDNTLSLITSHDGGTTWSAVQRLWTMHGAGVTDPDGAAIRTGTGLPSLAIDPGSGAIALTWEDQTNKAVEAVLIMRSTDSGATWSAPKLVNGNHAVPAFTPTVAIAADGTLGVSYYDLRDATDPADFRATAWLATSRDAGATWTDAALGLPFPLAPARLADAYYLGDSQGLAVSGTAFVPLFAGTHKRADERTDVFVRAAP